METWKLIHDFDKAAILKLPRTNTVKLVISLGRLFGSKAIQCCSCIYLFVFVQFIPIMYSEGHFRKKKEILYKIQQSKLQYRFTYSYSVTYQNTVSTPAVLWWTRPSSTEFPPSLRAFDHMPHCSILGSSLIHCPLLCVFPFSPHFPVYFHCSLCPVQAKLRGSQGWIGGSGNLVIQIWSLGIDPCFIYSHKLAILTPLPSNELSSYWLALTNGGLEQSMGGDQTCKSTKV